MKTLARFIVRIADLAEAEGRALREATVEVGLAVAMALGAVVVGVGGLALIVCGIFETLRTSVGRIGASLICGVFLMACAGGIVWLVLKMRRAS